MTAIAQSAPLDVVAIGALSRLPAQPVLAAKTLYMGQFVCAVTASGFMTDPDYATTGAVLGVAEADSALVAGESSGDRGVNLLCGAFWRPNFATRPVVLTDIGKVCYASDNYTVSTTSTDGPVAGIVCGVDTVLGVLVYIHPGLNYLLSQATLTSNLASIAGGLGASLIGFTDSGSKTTAATVDAALDEIYAYLLTPKAIPVSLVSFREVDSSGDVGNIAANGGVLASDTTPILRADAAEAIEISWAASNSDPIAIDFSLPADFDDTANVSVEAWVYSGTTDAADIVIETSWDGGAKVADAFDDTSTKSATTHKLTATIANGDIPAGATKLTLGLTPPAHTTNAIGLTGLRLLYTPKLA